MQVVIKEMKLLKAGVIWYIEPLEKIPPEYTIVKGFNIWYLVYWGKYSIAIVLD
jgi:hypothetical protein